jgi:hypothetical protein
MGRGRVPVSDTFAWRDGPLEPGPAILVDLDGTLSDVSGRLHHVERSPKTGTRSSPPASTTR